MRPDQLKAAAVEACIVAVLLAEAVLISKMVLARGAARLQPYLLTFGSATLLMWSITFCALCGILPSS